MNRLLTTCSNHDQTTHTCYSRQQISVEISPCLKTHTWRIPQMQCALKLLESSTQGMIHIYRLIDVIAEFVGFGDDKANHILPLDPLIGILTSSSVRTLQLACLTDRRASMSAMLARTLCCLVTILLCSQTLCFHIRLSHKRLLRAYRATNSAADGDWDLQLASPCKINLFLRIMGRRPNGYR
jgi:hypothetical protein